MDKRLPFDRRMKKLEKHLIVTTIHIEGCKMVHNSAFYTVRKKEYLDSDLYSEITDDQDNVMNITLLD